LPATAPEGFIGVGGEGVKKKWWNEDCHAEINRYTDDMSYKTVEVELENGRVHPSGTETLPDKAHALLTILVAPSTKPDGTPSKTMGDALRKLNVRGRGEYSDLSTNKAHMDDFGR
jgi:hypothetical protein